MTRTSTLFANLCTILVGTASAEPLRATVVDATTLAPVAGAALRVGERRFVAGADGVIVLDGIEAATLVVASGPGYEPSTQEIEPGDEPAMVLLFAPGSLDEVVEIRGHAPRPPSDGGYTLDRDEIRHLPGGRNDALAGVRSLPGVGAAPPVAAGRLVIRGGAPQDSLLAIDGVPVPFVYHSFDQSTIVPVSMIAGIQYSPGGFGVDEGRATSGTVALLTSDEPPAHPEATATLSLTDVSGALTTPLSRRLYLSGGVRRSTVDVLMPLVLPDDAPIGFTTTPRYYDGQLRLDWIAGPRDRASVLALTSYDRLGVVNAMPTADDLPSDFATDVTFARVIASWKHEQPGTRNRLVVAAGNGDFHADYDALQHVDDTHVLALVRDDLSHDLADTIRVRGGVLGQLEHHELDARTVVIPSDGLPAGTRFSDLPIYDFHEGYGTSYAAAYLAADLQPTASTTITAGARLDYFARIDAAVLEPRVEIAQRAGTLTLRAAAGRYARDLSQAQALDRSLSPEVATQLSTGADIALADGLSARATVYYTRRDQLAVEASAPMATLTYASTGSGSSGGVDLLLRYQADDVFAWLAYSYGNSTRRDRDGAASHATAFDQSHALTALASYQLGAWRLGGRFQLATGLPYTDIVAGVYDEQLARYLPVFGAPYGTRYPAIAHVDLRVERQWHARHVDLAAFIDAANVFRSEHVQRYRYNEDFSEKRAITDFIPLPSIGVRGEF